MANETQADNSASEAAADQTTEALNDQTQAEAQSASESTEGEKANSEPFHKNPRFQELVSEKNTLKRQVAELQAQVASTLNKEPEISPEEETYKDLIQYGLKEDQARALAKTFIKASTKVTNQRVGPVEMAALEAKNAETLREFAKTHEDFEEIQPQMYDAYMALDPQSQALVASGPAGVDYLYYKVKKATLDKEVKSAYEKGISEGMKKKGEKIAGSPTSGASTAAPKSQYSDEDIANMSPADYKKARSAIFVSRGMKPPSR